MTAPLNWHFPRAELAEQVMDRFQVGATTALTLFAPRRMGKTEFVNKDLLPLAEKQGYLTAYVNFWDRKQNPADSLIVGLTRASASLKRTAKLKTMLGRVKEGSFNTPIGGAGFTLEDKGDADKLDIIQQLFELLLKDERPLLLALDEVQHLASNSKFEPIIFALRGIIDLNRDRVRVLYTASSRDGLRRLFTRRNAALFSSSQQIDLPTFGHAYLEYTAGVFKQATGRTLNINECAKAFRAVKKVPYDFRGVIDMLITHGGTDIIAVTELYLADNSQEDTYRSSWDWKPLIPHRCKTPSTGSVGTVISHRLPKGSTSWKTPTSRIGLLRQGLAECGRVPYRWYLPGETEPSAMERLPAWPNFRRSPLMSHTSSFDAPIRSSGRPDGHAGSVAEC